MASVLFEQTANIKMTHIPYKGGGDALAALMGGQIDLLINPLLGDVQSDKIISLAISGNQRSPLAPEVPTFKEAGFDFNIGVYYGVIGPKGINPKVLEQLNQYFNEAISDKDLVEVITNKSGIVLQKMTPSEFGDYLTKDIELWKKVVSKKVS